MTRKEALSKAIMTLMYFQAHFCKSKEAVENTQAVIDALEQIEKEPKWILVSERLPENKTYVLTTIHVPGRLPHSRSGWYQDGFFHNDNGDTWKATDIEVIAWMPLPEPYKAESEDKE